MNTCIHSYIYPCIQTYTYIHVHTPHTHLFGTRVEIEPLEHHHRQLHEERHDEILFCKIPESAPKTKNNVERKGFGITGIDNRMELRIPYIYLVRRMLLRTHGVWT